MPTSMEKPLDGAGLAVVNQVFNERLSQMGGSGGGVDWSKTPYVGMNYFNTSDVFGCVWMTTETVGSRARFVRGIILLQVKKDAYAGKQAVNITIPGDHPALTFAAVSNDIPMTTGEGTAKLTMTGTGTKVSFTLNPDKAAVSSGLYFGCATATITG